jgi:exopolysaccharide biosynthesis protein
MTLASRRKRSFLCEFARRWPSLGLGALTLVMLVSLSASAPVVQELPAVEDRFADWARAQNGQTLQALPGNTPAPGSVQVITPNTGAELPDASADPFASPPPMVVASTEAPVQETYPDYPSGSLQHNSDTMEISIEQYQEEGLVYFVADILVKDPAQLAYAFSYDTFRGARESVSDIADRNASVLAINGDFCGFHNEGVIIRGGEVFRRQNSRRHLMIVDQNGDMSVLTDRREKQGLVANRLEKEGTLHTFEFGPVLVKDGEVCDLPSNFFISTREDQAEPRTAIGQIGPLHYIVIVADGRQPGYSDGATLPQLQDLFLQHGAQFAFNLDGGGSTTLYFNGAVINHPSSGDERRVSDIVMFMD